MDGNTTWMEAPLGFERLFAPPDAVAHACEAVEAIKQPAEHLVAVLRSRALWDAIAVHPHTSCRFEQSVLPSLQHIHVLLSRAVLFELIVGFNQRDRDLIRSTANKIDN